MVRNYSDRFLCLPRLLVYCSLVAYITDMREEMKRMLAEDVPGNLHVYCIMYSNV